MHPKTKDRNKQRVMELGLLEPPTGLLPFELIFLREYATHGDIYEAAQSCSSEGKTETRSKMSLIATAGAILKKPIAQQYMLTLQKRLEELGVASMLETQLFLSDAQTVTVNQIDGDHPLCQTKTVTTTTKPDGTEIVTEKFTMVDKLKATEMLNKMTGREAPKEVIHSVGEGHMVVPLADSMQSWTELAGPSQKELMDDAIDI